MRVSPACFILLACLIRTAVPKGKGDLPPDCNSMGCEHGGTCEGNGLCSCTSAFAGDFCEDFTIDIRLADDENTIEEGDSTSFSFVRQNTIGALDVSYDFTGSFSRLQDTNLAASSGTIHFPHGEHRQHISLVITDDPDNEIQETITVTLYQTTYIVDKTLYILPSDPISVSVSSPITEDASTLIVNCSFPADGESLTFSVGMAGSSTVDSNDFSGSGGQVTCSSATPNVTIPYTVLDDDLPELTEYMDLTFTFPNTAFVNGVSSQIEINDNDAISISHSFPSPLGESSGNHLLSSNINFGTGTGSSGYTFPMSVSFAAIGGATSGVDYQVAEATSSFTYDPDNPVSSFNSLYLNILTDTVDEPHTEGIQITFSSSYQLDGDPSFDVFIQDDDDPTVAISVGTGSFENESPRVFTLTRSSTFDILTLSVAATEDSAQSDDYSISDGSVTFLSGTSVATVSVTITDDEIVENDEAFSLTFSGDSTTVNFSPSSTLTVNILNDDQNYDVSIRLHRGADDVSTVNEEDGSFSISLSRNSVVGVLDVELNVTSSDADGSDFTYVSTPLQFADGSDAINNVLVTILDDEIYEPLETLTITASWQSFSDSASLDILDSDPYNVVVSGLTTVQEEDGTFEFFRITRDVTFEAFTFGFSVFTDPGSSFFAGVNPGTRTIQQGFNAMTFTVSLTDDDDREEDDFVSIRFVGVNHPIAGEPIFYNFTVVNIDLDNVTATAVDTPEDDGFITVTVTRRAVFETLNVTVAAGLCSGQCAQADDYSLPITEFMFEEGSDTSTFNVTINVDTTLEANELLVLEFTPEATIAPPTTLNVSILNDDPEIITLPPLVGSFENDGKMTVELTRTVDFDPLTVNITTVDDTAVTGQDFEGLTLEPVTFPSGSLEAYIEINVTDNEIDDPDKVFQIQVTGDNIIVEGGDKDAHIFDDEGGRVFNCLRNGQNCTGDGDFCSSLPICYCNDTSRSGDQCNILTDNIIPCDPEDKCSGNGICTNVTNSCTCHDDYYGDECHHYFLYNMCNISSMVIIANPVGFFDGEIYVYGYHDVEECRFKPLDELEDGVITDDTLEGYGLVIHHQSSSCGDILPVEDGDITSYTRGFFIGYTKGIQMNFDQYVRAVCAFNNSNFELVIGNVTIVENSDSFVQENIKNLVSPVVMEAYDGLTVLTPESILPLNTEVRLRLSVPEPFMTLAIRDIWLENGLTGDDKQAFTLFEDGCVVPAAKGILKPIQYEIVGTEINKAAITFSYRTFAFVKSDRVVTYVTLRICVNATSCDVFCGSGTMKKRSTSEDTTVWTVFKVDAANHRSESSSDSAVVPSDSISGLPMSVDQSAAVQFVPTVAGLGVAAAVLVLISGVVLFVLIRTRRPPIHPYKRKHGLSY